MSALRARQAGLLVRPAVLGDGFAGVLVGAVGAVGIALCAVLLADPGDAIAHWPGWAAASLAAGTAGLLDDPARAATAASPTPLALRRGVGLAASLPIVVVAWIAVLALATTGESTPYGPSTRLVLTIQAAALITVALATAAVLLRTCLAERATLVARLVPVAVMFAAIALPDSVALLALPATPAWDAAAGRWAGLLVVSALVLAGTSRRD